MKPELAKALQDFKRAAEAEGLIVKLDLKNHVLAVEGFNAKPVANGNVVKLRRPGPITQVLKADAAFMGDPFLKKMEFSSLSTLTDLFMAAKLPIDVLKDDYTDVEVNGSVGDILKQLRNKPS